jgi:hypothetical protein
MIKKLKDSISGFMYGRYGYDKLGYALLIVYMLLVLSALFVKSNAIGMVQWLMAIYLFFRVLSRNISKRRAENQRFERLLNKSRPSLMMFGRRMREIRTHRYRKCPNCKTVLRLPRKTGKRIVVCPRCKREFDLRILF